MTRQLDSKEAIAGVPITRIRTLFRQCDGAFRADWLQDKGIDASTGNKLIRGLIKGGLIEKNSEKSDSIPWYTVTQSGMEVQRGSAAKRVTRSHASKSVDSLLERVIHLNQDSSFFMRVTELVIFGSFARDAQYLGDVDVAFRSENKLELYGGDFDAWRKAAEDHFYESGRTANSFFDLLAWPDTQLRLRLKNRQRTLSLHSMDEFLSMQSERETPYIVLLGGTDAISKAIWEKQQKLSGSPREQA